MPLPQALRSIIPVAIGLLVGVVGATMFRDSMLGAEGSDKERANRLELELQRAMNRIAALENAAGPEEGGEGVLQRLTRLRNGRRTLRDGARDIAEDIRAGRPVSPDDIFRASQPLMRDLAPLFDRMRLRSQQQAIDSLTGEVARKYDLSTEQQAQVRQWFEQKADEEAKRWSELVGREGTTLQEVMRASQDIRPDKGLDQFMPSVLSGEKLAEFQTDRLNERAQRVEHEADMKVQRLDSVVHLDDAQRDQVFAIMARNSKDYDPKLVLDGATAPLATAPTGNPQEAMLSVLRADQRAAYEIELQRRRERAARDMEAIGLTLPADWEMFDGDFR